MKKVHLISRKHKYCRFMIIQDVRNKVKSIVEVKIANFTPSYSLGIKDITSKTPFFEDISLKSTMLFHICVLYMLQGQDISQGVCFARNVFCIQ
jgi:hypothetical protein